MKKYLLLFLALFAAPQLFAQGVGINNTNSPAHSSAALDVDVPDKGVLIPRMTEAVRDGISSPETSLLIFQTDGDSGFYYYDGSTWQQIGAPPLPAGSIVLSEKENDAALINASFSLVGRQNESMDTLISTTSSGTWSGLSTISSPASYAASFAPSKIHWDGSNMIVLHESGVDYYDPSADIWTNYPAGTSLHTAPEQSWVWTGTEAITWGGGDLGSSTYTNQGIRYAPLGMGLTWNIDTTGAPSPRSYHSAIWTGTEMIIWGGQLTDMVSNGTTYNDGGKYNPTTDTWTSLSTTNAPTARQRHSAIWTGTEMIIWGADGLNTGGRYNPSTDTWTSLSTTNAPTARSYHTAIWTGTEMIVWGGADGSGNTNSGGIYNPSTDTWTPVSTAGAPSPRSDHTAVWTGTKMMIWGGDDGSGSADSGGIYDPATDTWAAIPSSGATNTAAPLGFYNQFAVWTGSEMIFWLDDNSNGRFDPSTAGTTSSSYSTISKTFYLYKKD